jgi:3-phosphoinositide dependent protein kinase-1
MERRKQTPQDFQFGKVIGEGSFSSVFLAREVGSGKEFAIKMCEKSLILREKKQEYIKSEKDILVKITNEWDEKRPFFVRLHSTFHVSFKSRNLENQFCSN